MARSDIEAFFNQIPIWMERDIFREIQLARLTTDPETKLQMLAWGIAGGGNLLAALGLISYTEALGRDRKSTRLNSSHIQKSRMPSSA